MARVLSLTSGFGATCLQEYVSEPIVGPQNNKNKKLHGRWCCTDPFKGGFEILAFSAMSSLGRSGPRPGVAPSQLAGHMAEDAGSGLPGQTDRQTGFWGQG